MKVVIQRVTSSKVEVAGKLIGEINRGFLLLVGIKEGDTEVEINQAADKISKMRIFEDENEHMNLALKEVNGEILSVSQFTLLANTKKGNRPSFTNAMEPVAANELFEKFNERLRSHDLQVATGEFGANMQVSLVNDGPVTIVLEY